MIAAKTHEEILIENGVLKEKIRKFEQLVSERRRIEEKLREGENWLRTIVEGTHALLVSVDINGHFTYTNDATARTLGYASSEELIGKSYLHFVYPEDRQRVLATFIKQVKVRQPSSIQELRIVCKDGTVKWFRFLSTLAMVDEQIIGQSGVAQDITGRKQAEEELRKSEEKYRTILENIEDGYFEVTLSGTLTFFNDSLCQIWGYPRNELLGMNYQQYTDAENADKLFRAFNKVFKTGIATKEIGLQIISKDGTPKHIETSVSLLKNSTNKTIGFKGIVRDITDRKQVEAVNARLLLRQRAILDNLPMMAWLKDTESRLEMVNEPYARACGRTIDECIGKTDLELYPLKLATRYMAEDREVCMSRQKKLVEECISTPDGLRWHLTYKTPIYNEQGIVIGTAGIAQDISKRKEAERLFSESQQKYKLLAENVDDIIWTMNAELTHYTYISPSIAKLGYTSTEFRAQPFDTFIVPQYRQRIQNSLEERRQKELAGKGDNSLGRWELELLKKNGETIYVESLTRSLRDENGIFQGLLGVTRDITERKRTEEALRESEEMYQSILRASPDNITITDIEGRILMISPIGVKMFGYDSEGEIIGDMVSTYLIPEDRERAMLNLALKAQGVLSGPDEYRGVRKDGNTFDIEVMSNFIRDDEQKPIRVVIVVRDITERKQVEEERKTMQAQLQQAQKMEAIGTLAGGIAHDFNNILGAILGYAEMAREECPPESVAVNDLNEVILASNRAKDLVKQILAFSRQTEAKKMPVRPAAIVKEAVILLRSSIPSIIEFHQDIDSEADLILADSTQFHQVIINLCTNAYHAMEEAGGTLTICLKNIVLTPHDLLTVPSVQPGHFVQLSIGDTGSGIAPEILEKIFDPYFTTKETGKGTGMGLAIVHGIVKSYGGFITCNSEIGSGTDFKIFLPSYSEEGVSETTEDRSTPLGTERILLVDDEEILARMGQRLLEKLGYAVTTRTSSLEAFATFSQQPHAFDMVITDQTMPGMTGFHLARKILQIRPDMPIVLSTGYSDQVSEEKVRSCGIRGFAMKPLAKRDIAVMIRRILDEGKDLP